VTNGVTFDGRVAPATQIQLLTTSRRRRASVDGGEMDGRTVAGGEIVVEMDGLKERRLQSCGDMRALETSRVRGVRANESQVQTFDPRP